MTTGASDISRRNFLFIGRRKLFSAILFVTAALFYFWLCTDGTWNLFSEQEFGNIFDYLAVSVIHGRLDLPPTVIGTEAFVVHGKFYGYWAPFPALLRIPLALSGTQFWLGHTARFSCWLAGVLSVFSICKILGELSALFGWEPKGYGFIYSFLAALVF
ncbi:MAG TPA: hypothetical protein VKC60_08820, partial [Opitutaceae bacterium]|nr:hypothetical protein [Opitutaceae bacterium]